MSRAHVFVSLRHRNARRFFLGMLISSVGTWVQLTALALLVYQLTGNATDVGLTLFCLYLPMLLIGAWAGGVADRHDKLFLTKVTQGVQCAQAGVLGVLTLSGVVTVPIVYALTLVLGVANAFDNSARRGFVTEMVEPGEIGNAVSLNTGVITGSRIVGPALGAALVGVLDIGWLFILNAVTFAALFFALFTVDRSDLRPVEPAAKGGRPVREALALVRSQRLLAGSFLLILVVGTFAFNYSVSLLKLADARWGDQRYYGYLLATMGVGSLAGSLLTASRRYVHVTWLYATCALLGVGGLALAWAPSVWFAAAVSVPVGLGTTGFVTAHNVICQQETPDRMRGRILALGAVALLGSTPIGAPITGWVADRVSAEWSLAYGSIVALVALPLAMAVVGGRHVRGAQAGPGQNVAVTENGDRLDVTGDLS